MLYIEIGETVELNGKKYICTLEDECAKCALSGKKACVVIACHSEQRPDQSNVIFVEIKE